MIEKTNYPALEFFDCDQRETMEAMQILYKRGYRYVARDSGLRTLYCYSLKPSKYPDTGWGYRNPDAPGALMAYPLRNKDIKEIDWSDKSATLIADFLKGSEFDVS